LSDGGGFDFLNNITCAFFTFPDEPETGIAMTTISVRDDSLPLIKTAEHIGRALIVAAAQGRVCCVRKMLHNGVPADLTPAGKPSALCYAALQNSVELAQLLLAHKADVNFRDSLGCTPAHYAVVSNALDCLSLLLDAGADVYALNSQRKPIAQYCRCKQTLDLLCSRGVVIH
jgi:ankyrin repeat protein